MFNLIQHVRNFFSTPKYICIKLQRTAKRVAFMRFYRNHVQ